MALLIAEDLRKLYVKDNKEFVALDRVSFSIEGGECVGLIGESGSGKTTAARIVAGLVRPSCGRIEYDGNVLTDAGCSSRARDSMQMVFQDPYASFSPRMKLGKGIREGLIYLSGLSAADMDKRVDEVMERVGLPLSYKDKYVFEVSGGESQRAAIARAILIKPKLLLCDEITSSLDVDVRAQLLSLLAELKTEIGMALLFISHDIKLVRNFCDRVYVMRGGRTVEDGYTRDMFLNPGNEYTKQLIDSAYLRTVRRDARGIGPG